MRAVSLVQPSRSHRLADPELYSGPLEVAAASLSFQTAPLAWKRKRRTFLPPSFPLPLCSAPPLSGELDYHMISCLALGVRVG